MTLYLENPADSFTRWSGAPINGVVYPRSIAQHWDEADLNAIGLYTPTAADAVPEGKIVTATSVVRVEGVVKFLHTLEDAPTPDPTTQTLTKRQVVRALIVGASIPDPDATVGAAMAAITDDEERALALADWRYAPQFNRDHPLFSNTQLLAALSLDSATIDALWAVGVDQPA